VKAPACPKCGSGLVGRTHRQGLYERLMSAAYVYPFRCQVCHRRFRRFRWRDRYVRVHLDRRDLERVPCRIPVTFNWKDGGQGNGMVRDISAAGCAIETKAGVSAGALLLLQISPEGEPPIDVDVGEVRVRHGVLMGVRFVKVSEAHAERLRGMIMRLVVASQG
jgi:c-di-GMP-binding flagellar brake protein YcgR